MLHNSPHMPIAYILDSFWRVLSLQLNHLKAFKPTSIAETIKFARLQEETLKLTGVKS